MICHWCRAALVDLNGRPRWNLFAVNGLFAFVCCDECVGRITRVVANRPVRAGRANDGLMDLLWPPVPAGLALAGAGRG